jgi:diketogulonate reductase-like aldo/keto reductase
MDLPKIGFGTWQLEDGDETFNAVTNALDAGYRLIDTARIYGNEASVGRAIAASNVARSDLIVTTKLWMSDMGYESALQAFDASLERLGLEYIDLYLVHWPGSDAGNRKDSWKALEEIKQSSRVKQIGVSNYQVDHLEELLKYANVAPAVNQIEFHPFIFNKQKPILDFSIKNDISIEAYSPLAQASKLNHPLLMELAKKYDKSPAQIMLAWAIAHNTVPLPRSSNKERIAQNFDIFDFKLKQEDIEQMNKLSNGRSVLG